MKVTLEPDIKTVEKESTDLVAKVNGLTISNQIEYEGAGEFLKHIKAQQKKVDETFDPIISRAFQTHKEACNQKNKFSNPLKNAEKIVKNLLNAYRQKKEAEAREAQRKLQELADKAARKQKLLDEQIAKAKESGNEAKVEKLEEKKENYQPPVVPVIAPEIGKVEGISYRDKWSAQVIDVNAIPREYMQPNMDALNKIAQGCKGSLNIPGVKFNCEKIVIPRL
jgi:hypothetical protein